ncbi:MAG: nitrate/nitrite transporter NrtS [Synechococcales cyanobacterium T60_A2020_003]|nr:nitrate/nitrite transporter NrtS [Synechococcales cyanobacterium T60_A2020_003]
MKSICLFIQNLTNPEFALTGLKVACVVGTLLFALNHGHALLSGTMTRDRWISALLTYCVPYIVNVHGQYTSALKAQNSSSELPGPVSR